MDYRVHIQITGKAIQWQKGKAGSFWSKLRAPLVRACEYPDTFAEREFMAADIKKRHPDWLQFMFIPHRGKKEFLTRLYQTDHIRATLPPVLEYYFQAIFKHLHNGRRNKAAEFAGCISHLIGDTGQPAHVVSDQLMMDLMPFPADKAMMYGFGPMIDRHVLCVNQRFVPRVHFDLGLGRKVKHPAASRGASLRNPAKPETPFLPVASHRAFWRRRVKGIAVLANMAPAYPGCRDAFVEHALCKGTYDHFEAVVGLNHLCDNQTGAIFEVWLDDRLVFSSPVLTGNDSIEVHNSPPPVTEKP